MAEGSFGKLGPIFSDIGAEAIAIVGGEADRVFLYVEAGDRWIGGGLFKDDGEVVRYFRMSAELDDLLWQALDEEEPAKRWALMEYDIVNGKFHAHFRFSDDVDVEIFDEDRREAAVKARFGDKPVVYPPFLR